MKSSFALVAALCLATTSFAQTTNPEVEPNETKAQATTNGTITITAGDSLTGTTTGTSTTVAGGASADTFRLRTATLPAGIYRHSLQITTTGTAGHSGSIRGLNQTDGGAGVGGVIGTTDNAFQTSSTTSVPARTNFWYGFGRGEELYWRVTGTSTTTGPYTATMATTAVTPTVVPGTFLAGQITLSTVGQTTLDTDIHLFDGNLVAINDASNDDESIAEGGVGTALQSQLRRNLTAGTYYLAIGRWNVGTNDNSPGTDDYRTGNVLDFPDMIACSSSTASANDYDITITEAGGAPVSVTTTAVNAPFELAFIQFTVVDPAPPFTAYCFGDGTGTACPCANNGAAGNGCASSINPAGGNIAGSGTASLAADTLVLTGTGLPNSTALYFQGTTQIASAFGDGLRCAGGSVIRLGTKTNAAGTSASPAAGDQSVSVRGAVTTAGSVRNYQVWYRNAAAFCTPSTFNLTNGLSVTWQP
jgi:hypothetical protein